MYLHAQAASEALTAAREEVPDSRWGRARSIRVPGILLSGSEERAGARSPGHAGVAQSRTGRWTGVLEPVRGPETAPHLSPRRAVSHGRRLGFLDILARGAAADPAAEGRACAGGMRDGLAVQEAGDPGVHDGRAILATRPCGSPGRDRRVRGLIDLEGSVRCTDVFCLALRHGLDRLSVPRLCADAREERRDAPHRPRRRLEGVIVSRVHHVACLHLGSSLSCNPLKGLK
eukprot:CAMPEP_0180135024 /NCGR_PEP_ID=MMETSP0986-20121125/10565_1 /TAXON_ID=697907 /ORGANISM="non described non described, Strain CCMP2293" /LENGTH=230 /DNA_ID=CAMNT_0022075605 /DNA_START=97 /DNA_END=787 /DNA_ORIENTATION=+